MFKILFVYNHEYPHLWRDGLYQAMKELEEYFEITYLNLKDGDFSFNGYNLVLGWGAFGSRVDRRLRISNCKKGLLIAGNAIPPHGMEDYDVLFHETDWYKPQIKTHVNFHKAFGINTDIYKNFNKERVFDYITVGSFSYWKRQDKLVDKPGLKIAIGEIQKDNLIESYDIINKLLKGGIIVSDMIKPEELSKLYNLSKTCYIPAAIDGGGERSVLEARACGCRVEIEKDNPKLKELKFMEDYSHKKYAKQLRGGVLWTLK